MWYKGRDPAAPLVGAIAVGAMIFGVTTLPQARSEEPRFGFGRAPTAAELAAWDIDVRADGQGLPPGRGTVRDGASIFKDICAGCHGERADRADGPIDPLVGGSGTLATSKPVKTVGSYWPYATTLFDFIRRAMPFSAPQSLTADQVYAVTAYLLSLNGIVPEDAALDGETLPKVRMPNRDGFVIRDWRRNEDTDR